MSRFRSTPRSPAGAFRLLGGGAAAAAFAELAIQPSLLNSLSVPRDAEDSRQDGPFIGCLFCNELLPPCSGQELAWKSCLIQRAGEPSVRPLKTIQVSISQRFPGRGIFREVPSAVRRDGLVTRTGRSWLCPAGAHRSKSAPVFSLQPPDTGSATSLHAPAHTAATGGRSRLGEHPHPGASPAPPQKSPGPATLGPTGVSAAGRDGTAEPRAGSVLPPGSCRHLHGDPAITCTRPATDICFACSKSWEAIITAPGS